MGCQRWFQHCNFYFIAIFVTIGPHLMIDGGKVRNKVSTPLMRDSDTYCLSWLTLSIAIGG
jgi:hypothetical protein